MGKPRTYTGEKIDITFDMARCIHARNCFLKLPQVFDPDRRPWVDPDAASADEIAAMIRTCPSGALSFHRRDETGDEVPPGVNRVSVLENGPLAFHGDLTVGGEQMTRATLCRCGKTKNPPFCDYSHVAAEFQATGEPAPEGGKADVERGGALEITGFENGPLQASGSLEVTTGTGHRIGQTKKVFLCRCGLSKNKPYCDSSHRAAGFTVPEV